MADVAVGFTGTNHADGPFTLTTTRGWIRVIEWVETLPAAQFPALHGLAQTGSWLNTETLAAEVVTVAETAPEAGGVRGILRELAEHLGVGQADERVIVSDGSGDDE